MIRTTYDDSGLQRHLRLMRELLSPAQQVQIMTAVGRSMGVAAEASIPEYPAPSGKPRPVVYSRGSKAGVPYLSKFKTQKQQGYFFWALAHGQLRVPTRRTGQLGQSITSAVIDVTAIRVVVAVGTNARHAPWVIDESRQAQYHQGTWWALQPVVRKAGPSINQAAGAALQREVKARLGI